MFKRSLLLVVFAFFIVANSAYADYNGWKDVSPGVYIHEVRGKVVEVWFGIWDYTQPTTYTCGSTTIAMQMAWETYKKGRGLKYDPMSIYNYINTDGQSSINTDELKSGIAKMVSFINRTQNLGLNVWMYEQFDSNINAAISTISIAMQQNNSPVIIYGNTKYGFAGGHYYLATGMAYCPKGICQNDIFGLYINDSVYNSPAYSIPVPGAISPRKYVSGNELGAYWQKTGGYWNSGHGYLRNGYIGI